MYKIGGGGKSFFFLHTKVHTSKGVELFLWHIHFHGYSHSDFAPPPFQFQEFSSKPGEKIMKQGKTESKQEGEILLPSSPYNCWGYN